MWRKRRKGEREKGRGRGFATVTKECTKRRTDFFFPLKYNTRKTGTGRSYRHKNHSKNSLACINTEDTDKDNAEKQHTFTFKSQEWNSL